MSQVEPTLRLVDPRKRVDRVTFHPKAESTEHLIHVGVYRCPHCGTETEFHTGTLRQWAKRRVTPFGPAWEAACTKTRSRSRPVISPPSGTRARR